MSKRALVRLAVVLAVAQGSSAPAQAPSRETDSLLKRVRVLDSAMLTQARTVDSTRRALVRRVPSADVRVGVLHIRTETRLEPRVRAAAQVVTMLIDGRGGTIFAKRASAHVPTITRDSAASMFGTVPVIAINADTSRRWSMIGQRHVPSRASAAELADGLAVIVEQFAMQGVDSAFAAWVMLGRAPLRPATAAENADAYLELATTQSIALRRCRARDLSACLDALGIDSMPGSRLARWYAPEDYWSIARMTAPAGHDSVAVAAWIRCRRHGDEQACRSTVTALANERVPLPFSASARFMFLREVLDAGGPGAFDRLIANSGTVHQRLEAAANEPLDRTVTRWLDRIERSRPDRMRTSGTLIVASLGWTAVILGLALGRRTSWA